MSGGTPSSTSHVAYECRRSRKRSPPATGRYATPLRLTVDLGTLIRFVVGLAAIAALIIC